MICIFDLLNFRNYEKANLQLSEGTNIFIGPNGQGKTNLLEGIYYLLNGRSYRAQRESELIRWGENFFQLYGEFSLKDRKIHIESHYQNKHKSIKVNGVSIQKLSEYIGTINAVSFSPDDLNLVKGGPVERRKFIDIHLAQIRPGFVSLLNSYNKVLQQKNSLLKSSILTKEKRLQLPLWNEQMISFGTKIILNRLAFVERLNQVTEIIYKNISSGKERIGMFYYSLGKNDGNKAIELFPQLLENKMDEEIDRQMLLVGPHRDDLMIDLNEKPARLFASQGQQRSIVLSLKLAELQLIQTERKEYPLLLLDDVLSELDQLRRHYLIDFISSAKIQTFLTMTNSENKPRSEAVFKVDKGQVWREK